LVADIIVPILEIKLLKGKCKPLVVNNRPHIPVSSQKRKKPATLIYCCMAAWRKMLLAIEVFGAL